MTSRPPYRILVTGWRDWPQDYRNIIWQQLDRARWEARSAEPNRRIVVVQGECPYGGADLYAKQWVEAESRGDRGISVESYPAERGPQGQILGPARNSRMVDAGADLCLAFPAPKSKGTWDCVRKAVDADIPLRVVAWCSDFAKRWAEELDL